MKYLFLIYANEAAAAAAAQASGSTGGVSPAYSAYSEAMHKAGILVGGERLSPTNSATTVRVRDGKTQVLDGPYADTKEQLGGYYMVDVPDIDAALAWAARCPGAGHGALEVRPVWEM